MKVLLVSMQLVRHPNLGSLPADAQANIPVAAVANDPDEKHVDLIAWRPGELEEHQRGPLHLDIAVRHPTHQCDHVTESHRDLLMRLRPGL
jgi:hypothetical protein